MCERERVCVWRGFLVVVQSLKECFTGAGLLRLHGRNRFTVTRAGETRFFSASQPKFTFTVTFTVILTTVRSEENREARRREGRSPKESLEKKNKKRKDVALFLSCAYAVVVSLRRSKWLCNTR